MEVVGRIKVINPEQQVTASFKKRELVVTTDEQYPQHILVEFVQDKTELLNSFQVGEDVKVSINIRGREWVSPQGETKYFNSIHGWRVERLAPVAQAPAPGQAQAPVQNMAPAQAFQPATDFNEQEHDDLPF
jgi:translation initiation factor IF-3